MSENMLQQVADRERQAETVRAAAQDTAAILVDKARQEGEQLLFRTRQEAQAQAKELLAKAEADGKRQAQEVLEQAADEARHLKQSASQQLDQVAAWIVGRVVRD